MATTVHDEDEGVSIRLGLLLEQPKNQAKLEAARLTQSWKLRQQNGNNGELTPHLIMELQTYWTSNGHSCKGRENYQL